MSRERLEEIERLRGIDRRLIAFEHTDWLIKQAKRVQELEEECAGWKEASRFNDEKLEKQNKRYRAALGFYADERSYEERDFGIIVKPAIQDGDRGKTARKALEGEK